MGRQKAWLVAGNLDSLLDAIQQRATTAEFGFDKQPLVYHRRAAGTIHRGR